MRGHLKTLVQRTPDFFHLLYVIENLRVPAEWTNDGAATIRETYSTALHRLLPVLWTIQAQTQFKTQTELAVVWGEVQRSLTREQDQDQARQLEALGQADSAKLQAALTDKNPLMQLTAIQAIHRRRVHLEKDLIERLTDPQPLIRVAARQALVRLARGTDFGPEVDANQLESAKAVRRWQSWLAQQEGLASAAAPAPPDPVEAEATPWAVELVQTPMAKEAAVLERLRTAPEPQGTLALAAAVRELKAARQTKAREALAQRLAEQGEDVLKKRLADTDAEIRRAAVTAAGMVKAKELIPGALRLLEDPDTGVAQAARVTLRPGSERFAPRPFHCHRAVVSLVGHATQRGLKAHGQHACGTGDGRRQPAGGCD